MNIVLISIGTRGDMEPFLAIGQMLHENGHEVVLSFPEQFRDLATGAGIKFASLGTEFIDMLESDIGKKALGGTGTGIQKLMAYIQLAGKSTNINKKLLHRQKCIIETVKPDRILYNGKTIYPLLWELENNNKSILISPVPYVHYIKSHAHIAFKGNFGPLLNKLTFKLANFGLVTTALISKKWLKIPKKLTRRQIRNVVLNSKAIYTISPNIIPRPVKWPDNVKVLGYQESTKRSNWQPEKELLKFIAEHDKILFITFGSMTNPDPEGKTKVIVDILLRHKIPAIINTAAGGLTRSGPISPETLFFVSDIPYNWILPKVYAVIHHGGSGTTHLALKYGCASLIIPHIIDQFVWAKIVCKLGAGPKSIKLCDLKSVVLENRIVDLMSNTAYKNSAILIGQKMKCENFNKEVLDFIVYCKY